MLILPQDTQKDKIRRERESLSAHFNAEMEKILNENSAKDTYWILGKVKFPEEMGGKVGRSFLQASDSKPPLIKEAFLYEVDNRRGVKTLLWVMHPDGSLRLPTVNKTIRTAPKQSKGARIIS